MQQGLTRGQGRHLLALEALLLDEYDEVLVLDQKVPPNSYAVVRVQKRTEGTVGSMKVWQ